MLDNAHVTTRQANSTLQYATMTNCTLETAHQQQKKKNFLLFEFRNQFTQHLTRKFLPILVHIGVWADFEKIMSHGKRILIKLPHDIAPRTFFEHIYIFLSKF